MHADTTPAHGSTALADDHQIAYRVPHAAQVVDLSERQMWKLVRDGEIESFKIGTSRRIPRAALVAYIERMRAEDDATHPPSGPSTPTPPPGPKAGFAA